MIYILVVVEVLKLAGPPRLTAASQGVGLAFVMEDLAEPLIKAGKLVRVLADWCPPFGGYHLYYPDRRQLPPAFTLLVNALRYRAKV